VDGGRRKPKRTRFILSPSFRAVMKPAFVRFTNAFRAILAAQNHRRRNMFVANELTLEQSKLLDNLQCWYAWKITKIERNSEREILLLRHQRDNEIAELLAKFRKENKDA
jgi:hypothetical protein